MPCHLQNAKKSSFKVFYFMKIDRKDKYLQSTMSSNRARQEKMSALKYVIAYTCHAFGSIPIGRNSSQGKCVFHVQTQVYARPILEYIVFLQMLVK